VLELTMTFCKEITITKIESNPEIVPKCSKVLHEKKVCQIVKLLDG